MIENEKYALILIAAGNAACVGVGTSEEVDEILATMNNINEFHNIRKIRIPDTVIIDENTPSKKIADTIGSLVFD